MIIVSWKRTVANLRRGVRGVTGSFGKFQKAGWGEYLPQQTTAEFRSSGLNGWKEKGNSFGLTCRSGEGEVPSDVRTTKDSCVRRQARMDIWERRRVYVRKTKNIVFGGKDQKNSKMRIGRKCSK